MCNSHMTNTVTCPSHMTLSHACGHMTFENHSATAHAKLAPSEDREDLFGSCLYEDHFMSVPLVACNLSCSFFIIPIHTTCSILIVLSRSRISLCSLPYIRLLSSTPWTSSIILCLFSLTLPSFSLCSTDGKAYHSAQVEGGLSSCQAFS